jgi:xanthine dehydrogenase accessory factor
VFGREQLRIWQEGCQAKQTFCSVLLIEGREKQLGKELIILEDGRILGEVFSDSARKEILGAAQEVMRAGKSTCKELAGEELGEIFFHLVHPQPTLILVGGVHIALPLIKLAEVLEFEVVVIDPRKLFGTAERFPEVSALLTEWPDAAFQKVDLNRSTAVVTLTHDPKIDDPALKAALASPAFYIGALGSRKTHQQRKRRLVEDGFNQEQLQRVHAPVGLDLGGRSPQEIALSIMAEVVKAFNSAGQGS